MSTNKKRVILAYSGGLDTSAIIPWLIEKYSMDVVAYCCDVGNQPDPDWLKKRALSLGAVEFIFEDLKTQFAENFVFPMVRAGATYQQDYLLGTAIARPLIAERVAEHARRTGAEAIAHGATGKGNDHIRFERAWAYLVPEIQVIVPWKEWSFTGRRELQEYLLEKGHKLDLGEAKRFSVDSNLFHCSTEGDILEDVEISYNPYEVLKLTDLASCQKSPEASFTVELNEGIPVSLNGRKLTGQQILEDLNEIGRQHGVGIVDLVEERANGIKSRGVYETPGGYLLHFVVRQMKQICWGRDLHRLAGMLGPEYGQLIYDGQWHSETRNSLEDFYKRASQNLTGEVGVRLVGSNLFVTHRKSDFSLYSGDHVSFEKDKLGFNKAAANYMLFATYPNKMQGRANRNLK